MKRIVRITESDINRIVKESVNKMLREAKDYETKEEQQKRLQKKNGTNNKFKDYSDDDWQDIYKDKEGRRIQSKGHGSKKQWRTLNK